MNITTNENGIMEINYFIEAFEKYDDRNEALEDLAEFLATFTDEELAEIL